MKRSSTPPNYPLTKLVLAIAMLPGLAAAQSEQHGAHFHGLAELMVVAEDNMLELEFNSPAMSIVGFEHPASNPEQKANVKKAEGALNAVTTWLTLEGAQCSLASAEVDMAGVAPKGGTSTDDHGEELEHDDEHDHGDERHHRDTGHSHDDHHDEIAHSDITAVYTFDCKKGGALSAISLVGGELPFALEEINLMWVTDAGQGAATLRPGNTRAELR